MNEAKAGAEIGSGGLSPEQRMSALFTGMVLNQAQLALMLMGIIPHPGTGQTAKDLDGARLFIDQLEMLEEKTKGNLDQHERKLLRDQLTALRMAFVEASSESAGPAVAPAKAEAPKSAEATGPTDGADAGSTSATDQDSRKKFSKKY
jgi:hypothetical protein